MSSSPLAQSNNASFTTATNSSPATLPSGPMRHSCLTASPSPPCESTATAADGSDVTPTSPSSSSSSAKTAPLVSIRPLPSPSLYQATPTVGGGPQGGVPVSTTNASACAPKRVSLTSSSNSSVATAASSSNSSTGGSYAPSTMTIPMNTMVSPSSVPPSVSTPTTTTAGPSGKKVKENTGRWLTEEHDVFLRGLDEHGKQWKKIAEMIGTRSVVQVRTHAQKYFQKLLKNDAVATDHPHKLLSGSTAVSTSAAAAAAADAKRKFGTDKTAASSSSPSNKKRRMSLEPKTSSTSSKKYQSQHHRLSLPTSHYSYQQPGRVGAPMMPVAHHHYQQQSATTTDDDDCAHDDGIIDPSFMQTLKMAADGDLDDSLLDLLDDNSVDAVEQVIGAIGDDLEPNPVSPSVSSVSLAGDTSMTTHHYHPGATLTAERGRQDTVSSPNPIENFSIHDKMNGMMNGQELSPTTVTCTMDIKDFEQKTAAAAATTNEDALDWLMDEGWNQLPATVGEVGEDWSNTYTSIAIPKMPLTTTTQAKNTNAALSAVKETNVF